MDDNFTRFLSYTDIINTPPDLLADLFGIDEALGNLLPEIHEEPDDKVIAELFEKIRQGSKSH